jgi:alpha-glucoside transport system substrate-binding protein
LISCSPFEQFGDLAGTRVSILASADEPTRRGYEGSWLPFEECTNIEVRSEWAESIEPELRARVDSDDAPDVAIVPTALLGELVRDTRAVMPVFEETASVVAANFSADWRSIGTVDGMEYAFPNSAGSKSLVWYSPRAFWESGYEIPTTWDELITLSDRIVADNPGGAKPWCAGLDAGEYTGWPLTDWVEDVMLREQGPEYYDSWVRHDVPFNASESLDVWQEVGAILRNPRFVNGGFGDVTSIATTPWDGGGMPILDGACFMHKMASFYAPYFPDDATIAEDGDVFAFYFPTSRGTSSKPVLAFGDVIVAFADRPEVRAFATYLATADYANARTLAGVAHDEGDSFISPNRSLDLDSVQSPLSRLVAGQFQDPDVVIRLDGSDQMPAQVGFSSFFTEATLWVSEGKDTQDVLDAIEASWPE